MKNRKSYNDETRKKDMKTSVISKSDPSNHEMSNYEMSNYDMNNYDTNNYDMRMNEKKAGEMKSRKLTGHRTIKAAVLIATACVMLFLTDFAPGISAAVTGAEVTGSGISAAATSETGSTAGTSTAAAAGGAVFNAAATSETGSTAGTSTAAAAGGAVFNAAEQFSDRDLEQIPDLREAVYYDVSDGEDIHITGAGMYVLRGSGSEVTVYVEAGDEDKVQLVLDGVTLTNSNFPCIYVKSADKVFVTTSADSALSVTGAFVSDGDVSTDGVIFSRSDLTLNGTASLKISSTENGVVSKDDLRVTGGSYTVTASSKCFEAHDSIRIAEGTFNLTAGTDALHAEYDEDDTVGYIYIADGDFSISVGDDALHATTFIQIDDGTFNISAVEGIEGTFIQINGGEIYIEGWDDGINGAHKSSALQTAIEINGGSITVVMASGDTDAIDCNGNLTITGGTINVTGSSTFDIDGTQSWTGGTIIVNGREVDTIPNQMMGGRGGKRW